MDDMYAECQRGLAIILGRNFKRKGCAIGGGDQ